MNLAARIGFVGLVVVLLSWCVASPIGASPDDDFHLMSSYCGHGVRAGLCERAPNPLERLTPLALHDVNKCYQGYEASAGCLETSGILARKGLAPSDRVNTANLYPPVYYFVTSFFVDQHVEASALRMRLVTLAVVLTMFALAFMVISNVLRRALFSSWVVCSVPLGFSLMASNNPSSWAIAGISTFWMCLVSFFTSPTDRARNNSALVAVLAAIIAAGSRGDASVYLALSVIVATLYSWNRLDHSARRYVLVISTSLVVLFVTLSRVSTQTSALNGGLSPMDFPAPLKGLLLFNVLSLPGVIFGPFGLSIPIVPPIGYLGTFSVQISPFTAVVATSVFVASCLWLIRGADRVRLVTTAGLWACLIGAPLYIHQMDRSYVGYYVQPRYVLPLLFLISSYSFARRKSDGLEVPDGIQGAAVVGMLSLAHSAALFMTILKYTNGYTVFPYTFASDRQWWWRSVPSPILVWIVGSISFAVFASMALHYLRITPDDEATIPSPH